MKSREKDTFSRRNNMKRYILNGKLEKKIHFKGETTEKDTFFV